MQEGAGLLPASRGTFWLTGEYQEVATGHFWVKLLALSRKGLVDHLEPRSSSLSLSMEHTSPPAEERERGCAFTLLGTELEW